MRYNYNQKIMTHQSVMTSTLRIKTFKFCDFCCNIDYNSWTDYLNTSIL